MTMTMQNTDPGSKSAAEVEREVQQSRAKVERTLDQIQDRLSPGQMVDQAVSYFRDSGGSEFARNLGESIKENPMPIALVAVGVAWMMMSGQRRDHDRDRWDRDRWNGHPDRPGDDRADTKASLIYPKPSAPQPTGGPAASTVDHDRGGQDGDGAVERVRGAAQAARDKAGDLAGRARAAVGETADTASAAGADLSRKMQASAASASAGARRAQFEVERYGRRAGQTVLEAFQEQPLVLGAIGVAVGAALGAALPATQTEDELAGETSDRIKREAERTGREQLAKAQSAAEAAASAGLAEAERQGLSTDSVKAAADSVRSKAERVAKAATDAAKDQTEKADLAKRGVT